MMFRNLTYAITRLTDELRAWRFNDATKLDALLVRARKTQRRVEKLARQLSKLDDATP